SSPNPPPSNLTLACGGHRHARASPSRNPASSAFSVPSIATWMASSTSALPPSSQPSATMASSPSAPPHPAITSSKPGSARQNTVNNHSPSPPAKARQPSSTFK